MGITVRDYEQMQRRVASPRRPADSAWAAAVQPMTRPASEVVLGVDPSLRGTGYGIVRCQGKSPSVLAQGTVACPASWARSHCLARIAETLRTLIEDHRPTICVVEGLFHAQNIKTALIMGEARGAAMVAAAAAGLEICEIAPRKVKQAIVGYGGAHKLTVARMVQRLLNLAELPAPDAADALALALAYTQENRSIALHPLKRL